MPHIATEVHTEVSQIFHHDDIVLCSQSADDSQLLLLKTYPGGIVRVGVYDGSNVSAFKDTLQLVVQRLSTVVIDVKLLPLGTDNA